MNDYTLQSGLFGVELEYFLVNSEEVPVLGSSMRVIEYCEEKKIDLDVTTELSSFQIELNPGPWSLSDDGVKCGINILETQQQTLFNVAEELCLSVDQGPMPKYLKKEIIDSKEYFTDNHRYLATSRYFKNRQSMIEFEDGSILILAGEKAVGCLNEIHINIQLQNDSYTLELYNFLNINGQQIADRFAMPIKINNKKLSSSCTTMKLFEQANGEWNKEGDMKRVCFLPRRIRNYSDYQHICQSFHRIPSTTKDSLGGKFLDIESTVYFWVRLRGYPGDLRVEFRPIDMNDNWRNCVLSVIELIKSEFLFI